MQINMNNTSPNFNGFLQYRNNKLKMDATIDTQNIMAIQQKYDYINAVSEHDTDIIVKNTFSNNGADRYIVFSFAEPIENVIKEYNKACKNEKAELGSVMDINAYGNVSNENLFS